MRYAQIFQTFDHLAVVFNMAVVSLGIYGVHGCIGIGTWRFSVGGEFLPVSILSCYNSNWAPRDSPVLSLSMPHDYIHCSNILKSFPSPFGKCQECVLVVYKCRDPTKKNTKPVMKEALSSSDVAKSLSIGEVQRENVLLTYGEGPIVTAPSIHFIIHFLSCLCSLCKWGCYIYIKTAVIL